MSARGPYWAGPCGLAQPCSRSIVSSRMGETTSLTDAVKLAAGISLTEAVKGVAARRIGLADAALDTSDDSPRGIARHRARRLLAVCARIAAIAVLSLAFLLAGSLLPTGSRIADAD